MRGWNGLGFVVQAYGKRCPSVIDWLVDLGRRAKRRLMVRLVKGAYWDSEIKRAQVDGLADFPVFTRKVHTDVSYLACARKLLAAPDAVFPQFATHNAQTLAAVMAVARAELYRGQYEFQCLHGMGEPLYEEVVGREKLDRPCRIYAPVGTHETLLAYLVRRLLENGANTSFVNRIADETVPLADLIADPVEVARAIAAARRAARAHRAAAGALRAGARAIRRARSLERRRAVARSPTALAAAPGLAEARSRDAAPDAPARAGAQPRRPPRRRRPRRRRRHGGDRGGARPRRRRRARLGPREPPPSARAMLRRAADALRGAHARGSSG